MSTGATNGPNGGARYSFPRQEIVDAIVEGCSDASEDLILRIQKGIRDNLGKPGSGNWYVGQPARSSKPGEPPATQTGRLWNAWQAKPKRFGMARVIGWAIGSGRVPYARILEYGGTTGRGGSTRIDKRPYIAPAVVDVPRIAPRVFADYIYNSISRRLGKARGT